MNTFYIPVSAETFVFITAGLVKWYNWRPDQSHSHPVRQVLAAHLWDECFFLKICISVSDSGDSLRTCVGGSKKHCIRLFSLPLIWFSQGRYVITKAGENLSSTVCPMSLVLFKVCCLWWIFLFLYGKPDFALCKWVNSMYVGMDELKLRPFFPSLGEYIS